MLKPVIIKITANLFSQKLLEKFIRCSQEMLGIGVGAGVETSGEKVYVKLIKDSCTQPYCIFDVGANMGQFLNVIVEGMGNDTSFHIHSFEPCKYTFQNLFSKYKDNRHVTLRNFGLGDVKGEFSLYYDNEGSGLASLTKRRLDHFGIDIQYEEKVRIERLDDYCLENGIIRIDLLKIDVEGHELDVLSGSKRMFELGRIGMVAFEFGGCNIDTRTYFQDFFYFFKDLGIKIYRITPSGYLYQLSDYSEIDEQFRTTNFLAIKDKLR